MVRRQDEAVRITTANRGKSQDIEFRQRRYLVSMTIRTLCFLLAVAFAGTWLMWVFLASTFFLPTIAVVVANAGASPDPGAPDPFLAEPAYGVLEAPPAERS